MAVQKKVATNTATNPIKNAKVEIIDSILFLIALFIVSYRDKKKSGFLIFFILFFRANSHRYSYPPS
jgi:hypothetical protein